VRDIDQINVMSERKGFYILGPLVLHQTFSDNSQERIASIFKVEEYAKQVTSKQISALRNSLFPGCWFLV
jgi:hypothetical protein